LFVLGIREAAAQIIQDSEHKRGNGTKTIVGSLGTGISKEMVG
jgi:hypothetical protein